MRFLVLIENVKLKRGIAEKNSIFNSTFSIKNSKLPNRGPGYNSGIRLSLRGIGLD